MNKREMLHAVAAGLGTMLWPAQAGAAAEVDAAVLPLVQPVVRHYAMLVHASYSDSLAAALAMQQAIAAFLAQPSADTLKAARTAWLDAREWYGQTEAFRFYAGPVDDGKGPEQRMNTWPVDESYIDYVRDRPDSGLINNPKAPLTKAALAAANIRGGLENVSTGWHAIEFLLWGQDLSETGPGERPFEDYVDGKGAHADRRRQYLAAVTGLLIDDLRYLIAAWAPGAKANYRAKFERGGLESVRRIIIGIGALSRAELAGERMEVALNTQDQEDEQSCFSDNTHRDIVNNALGIENVWLGRFRRRDGSLLQGPSLRDLVAAKDAAQAERTTRQIAASIAAAQAIHPPFDVEIRGSRSAPGPMRVRATIDSVLAQARELGAAANAIGITRLNMVKP
ncbi:imelysin family protein [Rhizobacter sp. OV335]|uniref:imelysin family protein n=1 Tax=Rhizobacter sp. OV335 TaxID=1500264 RepID=UPI00091FD0B0|nr:imelysin family protein [Rhizobacter sp. OV335]SHN37195.1 putative iron-regulated protein [Rhizobacter sp. OV335]